MDNKFKTLVEVQEAACEEYKDRPLFGTKEGHHYTWITYGEFKTRVDAIRGGLASLGLQKDDKVAIIARNSVRWAVCAYASYGLGAQVIGMYEDQLPKEWEYIIKDSGAKIVMGHDTHIYEKIKDWPDKIATLKYAVNMQCPRNNPHSYESLMTIGRNKPIPSIIPDPDSPMGMIYTSGTTGNPKGVILTHRGIVTMLQCMETLFEYESNDRGLAFLPWAHIFGQLAELHMLLYAGSSEALVADVNHLVEDMSLVQPTIFCAVPRVYNKIYDGVQAKMRNAPSFVQKLFKWGMEFSSEKRNQGSLGLFKSLILWVADRIVFAKIRKLFGGRLRLAFSGASAMSREVGEFIANLGIEMYEGYGLSETTGVISVNYPGHKRIGSVGKPLPIVRVEIDKSVQSGNDQDGEIIAYGPNILKGYHNLPEVTKESLSAGGGFRTGDLGRLDQDGYLYITGRIKEQYKLENGKYVAPTPVEEQLKLSPYISQIMLYGDNKPYNIALIVPDLVALIDFAEQHHIEFHSENGLINDAKINELIQKEIERFGAEGKSFEQPKKFRLIEEEWTAENGLLTPTLKVKRKNVQAKYQEEIDMLYAS